MKVSETGDLVNTGGKLLVSNGKYYHGVFQLSKTISKNENWKTGDGHKFTSEGFTDKEGRTILTRNYVDDATPVETYNVYDDLGRLRYVIPPMAVSQLTFPHNKNSLIVKQLCFYYEYDEKNRMTIKQVPGAEPVYMVYDERDRLVLTQDGNLRKDANGINLNKWLFTKYDELNRTILTGIYTHPSTLSQSAMQSLITTGYNNDTYSFYEMRNTSLSSSLGYTENSFPKPATGTTIEYLSASYYDNYDFPDAGSYSFNSFNISGYSDTEGSSSNYFERVAGLITGTKSKVLGTTDYLTTVTYYDDKGRVIQTINKLYDGTTDGKTIVSNQYDFAGKLLKSGMKQKFSGNETTVYTINTYDHAGRVLKKEHQIGDDPTKKIVLAEMFYDELSQPIQKKLHNGSQTIDYSHNIRG
jgi:hypothetical protein